MNPIFRLTSLTSFSRQRMRTAKLTITCSPRGAHYLNTFFFRFWWSHRDCFFFGFTRSHSLIYQGGVKTERTNAFGSRCIYHHGSRYYFLNIPLRVKSCQDGAFQNADFCGFLYDPCST